MTTCKLGNFVFTLLPEREITFEDQREIAKVDIPGARPKYQDMGMGEKVITFSGAIVGEDAIIQSNNLQKEMHKGVVTLFTFGTLSIYVRIRRISKRIRRTDYVRYDVEMVEEAAPVKKVEKKPVITTKKSQTNTKQKVVVMKKGDTLIGFQKKYGVPWQEIAKASGIKNPRKIPVGAKIIIPLK